MTSPIETNNVVDWLRSFAKSHSAMLTENDDKMTPPQLTYPWRAADLIQSLSDHIDVLEGEKARLRRCLLPVQMMLAQAECVDEPIPDDAVVLHFMGSGASDQVTAGEVRASLTQGGNTNG